MEEVWCIVLDKRLRKSMILSGITCLLMTSYPMSIHAQEISQESIQRLEQEISQKLNDVNEKYRQVERLKQDLNELKSNQKELELQINDQQDKLAEKETVVKERMVALQSSGVIYQRFVQLLQATSISDFFHRLIVIQELFKSDILTIQNYHKEVQTLVNSQKELKDTEDTLLKKQEDLQKESTLYADSIQELKQNLATNKEALFAIHEQESKVQQLSENTEPTTHHAPEEKKSDEGVHETKQNHSAEVKDSTVEKNIESKGNAETSNKTQAVSNEVKSTSSGKEFAAEATAYSYKEAGLSYYTAMGIDLRSNPNVIAVDPSQIPLGTLVEVPGYGIAIAGDTGGDIKGNRIDVHYPEVQQAMDFGRQKITIKVMN